ncbi:MAG: YkgJ family cysteine cluster protein [Dehalococcoidales bacterium]|nr:YkgJ family cysteine cluster protein [Dehalococcoidales bacterium]
MSTIENNNLPCFRCGVCCRKYQVRVTVGEARNIAEKLGINLTEFLRKYTDPRWPGSDSFLFLHQKGSCIFLREKPGSKTTGCAIHTFRPKDCRDWTPGPERPECQCGLADWGLTIKDGGLSGSEEAIRKFNSFLDTLK